MNEPLIGCYLKVKRKTFWVYRWMEIDPDGMLKYRSKKEDKINKIELKLTECKINEVQSPDGSTVEIMPKGGEKIKFMANTQTEHKKIVQAIINLRKPPESVKQSIDIQNPQKKLNNQIIEEIQFKLVPDQKLITNTSDQMKLATQIYIKDFQNLYVHKVYEDIWQYQYMKVLKQNENTFILKLTEQFNQEIQNQGLPLFLAISTIFFLLITIVVYLMISFFDATPMFYSFTITLNLIAFPFALKFLTKAKQRELITHCMSKTFLKVDFNGLIFILTSQNLKPQWCPNVISFNDGITYKDGVKEVSSVNVYIESETAYVIENKGSTIFRVYEIINQSEELVQVKYYTKQIQSRKNLFCLKGFVKQQLMNPKSSLLEYLQQRNFQNYNQSEILYRLDNDQFRQSAVEQKQKPQSPLSAFQEQLIDQRPQISQVQSQVQQQFQQQQIQQPAQQIIQSENQINDIQEEIQIPPKYAHYIPITLKAKEFLMDVYPLGPAWQLQASHNGFVIHTRTDQETGLTLSRGEGIIPYKMEEIYDIIQKVDKRGDYDGLFDTGNYLVKLNEDIALIYQKFKTIKIVVASRDFVMITRIFREPDRWIIIAKSVEYPEFPPTKSIRGDTVIAGWILERIGDKTKACFITMVDPKGNIPAAIVSSSAKVQGECVEKIKNLLDKRKK